MREFGLSCAFLRKLTQTGSIVALNLNGFLAEAGISEHCIYTLWCVHIDKDAHVMIYANVTCNMYMLHVVDV